MTWTVAAAPMTAGPAQASVIRHPAVMRLVGGSGPGGTPGCFWMISR
jgi:hypothetical protein